MRPLALMVVLGSLAACGERISPEEQYSDGSLGVQSFHTHDFGLRSFAGLSFRPSSSACSMTFRAVSAFAVRLLSVAAAGTAPSTARSIRW